MRHLKAFIQITILLLLCVAVWLIVRMTGLIMSDYPSENLAHIPENANLALRIDSRQIAETTLLSILLESKDEQIIRLLENTIRQESTDGTKFKNTGINYLSDIIIFAYPYGKGKMNGIIYNLLDRDAFSKNMPDLIGTNKLSAASGNVGVVIYYEPFENESVNKSKLKSEAQKIVTKRIKKNRSIFHSGHLPGRYSELYVKTGDRPKDYQEIELTFEQVDDKFFVAGNVQSKVEYNVNKLPYTLKENGLHITNTIFTDDWADSLQKMLAFLSSDFPEISGFSMNYRGMNLVNHTTGYIPLPEIDLVVQCAKPCSIEKLVNSERMRGDLDYITDNGVIMFGDERFYYKQLNSSCFFIGRSESPEFSSNKENELFRMNGSLEPLTRIKGSGWGISLLKLLPIYQASAKLASSIGEIQLSITKTSKKNSKFTGSISFKKGFSPMTEVMRFLLVSQLLKSN